MMMVKILVACVLFGLSVGNTYAQEKELKVNEDTGLIEAVYYHENGEISQHGTFNSKGQLHGKWLSFNDKGVKIAEGSYQKGLKSGIWYFWQGDSIREVEYKNNAIASVSVSAVSSKGIDKN